MTTIKREEFLKALQLVQPGLASKDIIDQGQCFVFSGGDILTYNDEIAMRVKSPIDIEGAVVASPLLKLLQKMNDEKVEIKIKDGELRVTGKRKKGGVKMEAEISMPVKSIEKPEKFRKLPKEFTKGIETVVGSCGTDESKYSLTCVYISKDFMEGCDNFQITHFPLTMKMKKPILIPASSIRQLLNYKIKKYCFSKKWAHFQDGDGVCFSCRANTEEYPDLKDFLSFKGDKIKLPQGMKEAVLRAEIFSSEGLEDNKIQVSLRDGKLILRGEGDNGWYEESREVEYKGDDLSFLIDPNLLRDIVQRTDTCRIGEGKMKIETDDYVHVACLSMPEGEKC